MLDYNTSEKKEINEKIEKKLADIAGNGADAWVKLYRLMEEVSKKKLYRSLNGQYTSFTDWVTAIAKANRWSPATLWHYRSAGRFYDKYYEHCIANKQEAKRLEDIKINPENLNIIKKITLGDDEKGYKYIKDLLENETSYSELRCMWKNMKNTAAERSERLTKKNGYDKVTISYSAYEFESKVKTALSSSVWLTGGGTKSIGEYRLLLKSIGSKDLRPDAMAVENCNNENELYIHAFEIQTFNQYLVNKKLQEIKRQIELYTNNNINFLWMVVPDVCVELILKYKNDIRDIGVIGYNDETNSLYVYKWSKNMLETQAKTEHEYFLLQVIKSLISKS